MRAPAQPNPGPSVRDRRTRAHHGEHAQQMSFFAHALRGRSDIRLDLKAPISTNGYRELYRQQMALTCVAQGCNRPGTTLPSRDHFGRLANANGLGGTFVEIGVRFGDFAVMNLDAWTGDTYVMIDPERPSAAKRDEVAAKYRAKGRGVIHHVAMDFDVAHRYANNSLDVVYVDAGHSAAAQREYLARWWPKVRPGGILCGDDYAARRETLQRLWRTKHIVGPWIGSCTANESACPECAEQCRAWRLAGREHNSKSGVIPAVAEFARIIKQPVGVALAGRPASEAHMQVDKEGHFESTGEYWKRCDLPHGCFLESSRALGHYRVVREGQHSFDQPQFFFVKPLAQARNVPPGWGRHKRNCHNQPRFHLTKLCE